MHAAYNRAGTPSTIAPTPLQCDSPNVVTRKIVPKVLPDMGWTVRDGDDHAPWKIYLSVGGLGSSALP